MSFKFTFHLSFIYYSFDNDNDDESEWTQYYFRLALVNEKKESRMSKHHPQHK